jgi:hypothetical protein
MPKQIPDKRTRIRHHPVFARNQDLDAEVERELEQELLNNNNGSTRGSGSDASLLLTNEEDQEQQARRTRAVWDQIHDSVAEERTCACDTLAYLMLTDQKAVLVCIHVAAAVLTLSLTHTHTLTHSHTLTIGWMC